MHSGYLFKLTASRGYLLNPSDIELEELRRDHEARDELATMTVAVALPKFRERALIGGGWTYEGGASLPTYFMGPASTSSPTSSAGAASGRRSAGARTSATPP
jgi:hypothetical protein